MSEKTLTIGEFRVRTAFNPDNNSTVDLIKQTAAELINLMHGYRVNGSGITISQISDKADELTDIIRNRVTIAASQDSPLMDEFERLCGLAIGALTRAMNHREEGQCMVFVEECAMWAVKAATVQ